MAAKPTRVLIVDDSAVIRERIADYIEEAPNLEVAGKAASGQAALKLLEECNPDVVTLDIQMPGMDGLETLDAILKKKPIPVIMVSGLTQRGANITLEALDRGALDYVAKPDNSRDVEAVLRDELLRKIRSMAGTNVMRILEIRKKRATKAAQSANTKTNIAAKAPSSDEELLLRNKCIAIGISTGGPPALSGMFEALTLPLPPIVIVQHMPADFTRPFAWRLNANSVVSVKEAETGDTLKPNHAYLAPGGKHTYLYKVGSEVKVRVRDGEPVSGHKPSVDVMMKCVADIYGKNSLGLVMTGMGRDGSDGCGYIKNAGGYVLGQDQESSDVYGMNKVAFQEGNVHKQFSLDDAATLVRMQVKRLWMSTAHV